MMGIKETPTNVKIYYRMMKESTLQKKEDAIKERDELIEQLRTRHDDIKNNKQVYLDNYNINLDNYSEFVDNVYKTGKLFKVAKGLVVNKNGDYELISDTYDLYVYAELQKKIYDIEHQIALYDKLLKLTLKEYTETLRTYYTQVHKELVINGNGYAFGHDIGWICVNRIVIKNSRPKIDYALTKKRTAELKAQGKRIYNKEEAEWCKKNGIEYKAEDQRVFRNNEYCYEIPLIGCKLPGGIKLKLEISDYRHTSIRGKSNDTLIEECNCDINKICDLSIDLKTKVTLCDKADKILYTKFIRNEAQESVAFGKANSKD